MFVGLAEVLMDYDLVSLWFCYISINLLRKKYVEEILQSNYDLPLQELQKFCDQWKK
jgi:hypothetical protein